MSLQSSPLQFYWRLPNAGDGRSRAFDDLHPGKERPNTTIRDLRGSAYNTFDYVAQVARAAELTGFDGVVAPDDVNGDSSWITVGALAREIRRLKLIAEFTPAIGSAVYAAKQAVTFQRYTEDRLGWALDAGEADPATRRAQGDFVPDDKLAQRLDEFLVTTRGVSQNSEFTFKGEFFEVLKGGFGGPLGNVPFPELTLSGTSEEDLARSATYADVHRFALGDEDLSEHVARLGELAGLEGRDITISVVARVFARDDAAQAHLDASRHGFDGDRHTLIGDYQTVAGQLLSLADQGVGRFELHAPRSLEEAYRIGEHVLPRVRHAQQSQAA